MSNEPEFGSFEWVKREMNLPVPVPVELLGKVSGKTERNESGEAREGNGNRKEKSEPRGGQNNLSGDVDNSQETRWQNGKDIPEAIESQDSSPMRKVSGSEISLKQTSGSSEPPAQNPYHPKASLDTAAAAPSTLCEVGTSSDKPGPANAGGEPQFNPGTSFSEWLAENNDSIPDPRAFSEWLTQNNDSIETDE